MGKSYGTLTKRSREFTKFLKTRATEKTDGENRVSYNMDTLNIHKFSEMVERLKISAIAPQILANAMFVSLILRWDVYFTKLLRIVYEAKSGVVDSSERAISFSDLTRFTSIEEARQHIVEAEIEDLMRGSHEKHFSYLATKLGVKISRDEAIWKHFIEITERRNLIAHTDGTVSKQYIEVCGRNGVDLGDTCSGKSLEITRSYMEFSCDVLAEFAVIVGHILWRRIHKDQSQKQDTHHMIITYALVRDEKYKIAQSLIERFLQDPKNLKNEYVRKASFINLAQSYKWSENAGKCLETLNREDWSSSRDNFLVACHVLRDQFEEAAKLMIRIGMDGDLKKADYDEWPLFKHFRESEFYIEAYRAVFGEDTAVRQIPTSTLPKGETVEV